MTEQGKLPPCPCYINRRPSQQPFSKVLRIVLLNLAKLVTRIILVYTNLRRNANKVVLSFCHELNFLEC